ncbi:T9SS type B sorting domain-containing protein [Brumimicrobium oceani]|uniref:Gliding motility-associated C-terminal domain-containing protein n=1 Tax=Brumimicrobium oceani TaxID=2100725 RepID=A0A2U2XBJ7_9FLAO|nr:gliding motility-associated C-terminal domain-containing protein [Brumimicrobium oceani]PWH85174.1 hypothetical protein DIT68_11095 [Brumimicrobium oceani]
MKKIYLLQFIFILCISSNLGFTQSIYHQDAFSGGVTAGGLSSGTGGALYDSLHLHFPSGSSIRKLLLFVYSTGFPKIKYVKINGNNIEIDSSNYIMNVNHLHPSATPGKLFVRDLTNSAWITTTGSFSIYVPGVTEGINWGWYSPIIYLEYDNPNMNTVTTNLWINNQDYTGQNIYEFTSMNPINTSNPVGLSIFSDRSCNTLNDGTAVNLNGNLLGIIGGSDLINNQRSCGGAKGHFYYENQTFNGLDDDVSNNTMNETDAIADISTNLNSNTTNYSMKLQHVKYPTQNTGANNTHLIFINAYTSPCDTFSSTLTPDTTICFGQTLQLQATGGQSYEWSALSDSSAINDLSCTDCPNPIFSGDSSQVYTVRIWNTDSCSVVKPISIGVSHPSEIISSTFNSVCSFSTGKIKMQNVPNNVVQFGAVNKNGDTLTANSANTFNGLSAGDYTLFYIDKFGCSTDTVVTVVPVIDTKAAFATNPISGTAPIQINLHNNSVNATDYSWSLNGDYQGNQFSGFWTDTSGTYEIELIAWKTDSICADTVSFTVFIFDSLVASLPNVFTPNNDGVNDYFNVKVNLPVSYKLSILNRWGNLVFENAGDLTKGEHKLWNGETKSGEIVNDGTYFYKISFKIDGDFVDCELTECEVVKQGFMDVRK